MQLIKYILSRFNKKIESTYDVRIQNAEVLTFEQKLLLKICKKKLVDNGVQVNKIKFILTPTFTLDVDTLQINPTYKQLISKNKKYPSIEINKPKNLMTVVVGEYRTVDNYDYIKQLCKKTRYGLIVWANNIDYDEMIGIVNLDDAIKFYNENNHEDENELNKF
jgi:hypothetical protein